MNDFRDAVKKSRDGAILNLFVTSDAVSAVFPAGYNEWRKCIDIKVCSPARDNKANKEVVKVVADFFNRLNREILVVSGDKSREKTILVKGTSADKIIKKLKESFNGL